MFTTLAADPGTARVVQDTLQKQLDSTIDTVSVTLHAGRFLPQIVSSVLWTQGPDDNALNPGD